MRDFFYFAAEMDSIVSQLIGEVRRSFAENSRCMSTELKTAFVLETAALSSHPSRPFFGLIK